MPKGKKRKDTQTNQSEAKVYRHSEADSPLRPDVGTQAQFRKKKPPATYHYDSSLSPALDWDLKMPLHGTIPTLSDLELSFWTSGIGVSDG